MTDSSHWFTINRASAILSQLTGKPLAAKDVKALTELSDFPDEIDGKPLKNGKLLGPLAIRWLHGALVKKRSEFLNEERHSFLPPFVMTYYGKGGIGKTTISLTVALSLSQIYGFKVLYIDADPQATSSRLMRIDVRDPDLKTLYHALRPQGKKLLSLDEIKIDLGNGNSVFDFVASDSALAAFEDYFFTASEHREKLFAKNFISNNQKSLARYDFVIIDSNPYASSGLSLAIGFACDHILMPMYLQPISEGSMDTAESFIKDLVDAGAPSARVMMVANGYSPSKPHTALTLQYLYKTQKDILLKTLLPYAAAAERQGIATKDSPGLTLFEREPNCKLTKKLSQLSVELSEEVIFKRLKLDTLKLKSEIPVALKEFSDKHSA